MAAVLKVKVATNVARLAGNPYLDLWTAAVRASGARTVPLSFRSLLGREPPDVVHLQWPEFVLGHHAAWRAAASLARLLGATAVARGRARPVLVTAHNVWSHDRKHPLLERILWSGLGAVATDLHLLASAGDEFVREHPTFRHCRRHLIPHGHYGPAIERGASRAGAREALSLPATGTVYLTFGSLKAYKGTESVLAAFSRNREPSARLLVIGSPRDPEITRALSLARAGDSRIRHVDRFVTQTELVDAITACDIVVLPYRRVLNSGSAVLALTVGSPILVPDTATFRELARNVGEGWVHVFENRLELDASVASRPAGTPDLEWCGWDLITARLRSLWRQIVPR